MVRLERALAERIERGGQGTTTGVSLVDLESGLRFGIGDELALGAEGTIRIPVLLEVFRQIDRGSLQLVDLIPVNEMVARSDGSTQTLTPAADNDTTLYRLIGGMLPVRELVRAMIVNSSRLATNSLIQRITPVALQTMLKGLDQPETAEGVARALESIARCKMHSRSSCEEMTRLLSDHQPSEALATGSPRTPIAHLAGTSNGLHYEAGILYPERQKPYVLVIVTGGFANESDATRMQADLARLVANSLTESRITLPLR